MSGAAFLVGMAGIAAVVSVGLLAFTALSSSFWSAIDDAHDTDRCDL